MTEDEEDGLEEGEKEGWNWDEFEIDGTETQHSASLLFCSLSRQLSGGSSSTITYEQLIIVQWQAR